MLVTNISPSTLSYIATPEQDGLLAGTNYLFEIKAWNDVGYSLASDVVDVWLSIVPGKPTNLVVTLDSVTINVSWTAPTSDFTPIIRYWVLV